ncbi:hypothetical protein ACIB24_05360 [Spongisporangium articulatum]|uniref:DUF4157 domain-containing protein n=1 Tax=Spongisporangium articulatum TaxID=3362603 RepID=A0ABW8AJD4_9ACTN
MVEPRPRRRRPPASRPAAIRLRRAVNWVNLATPLGLLAAKLGHAQLRRGEFGLIIASGYRGFLPVSGRAMTIGDVVLLGIDEERLAHRPHLLRHEARHAGQYARWLGPLGFLPAYGLASAWSKWHTGNPALRNGFEVAADLHEGGYTSS